MFANSWLRLCRLKWLGVTTVVLCATFVFVMEGHATQHRGGNGPDGALMLYQPPTDSRFGGYVWGTVTVGGQPVAGAVVTMSYQGKSITATTLLVQEIEPFPIYMFGNRPLVELTATLNTTVTMAARYGDTLFPPRAVRLTPGADQELEVSFGGPPPVKPPTPPADPAPTMPLTSVAASHLLDAGGNHMCAVVSGAVWCWGQNNFYAQLGNGDPTLGNRSTPVRAGNITNAKAVSAASTHSCAVLLNGKVQCWGWNYYGQLGYPTTGPNWSTVPSDVLTIDNAVDIAVSHGSTCALLEEQRVKCFGYNGEWQIGVGITDTKIVTPTYVLRDKDNNLPLEKVTAIVSEDLNYCAIVDGGMWCWGQYRGSPAIGTATVPAGTLPTQVISPSSGVVSIETGYDLSCAVKSNGELWCYLFNDHSVYGLPFRQLVQIRNLPDKAAKVAVGHDFYCVLLRNGSVYCAGYNAYGQLGAATPYYSETPLKVAGLDPDIVDITAEWKHACVRSSQGKVQCWGSNSDGQLGDGTVPSTARYQATTITLPPENGSKLVMGSRHACRINTAGALQCWGANQFGQLGLGITSLHVVTPTTVLNMSNGVLAATAGEDYTCAIKQNGAANEVWCWGRGDYSQLGNGAPFSRSVPSQVVGLTADQPIELAAGVTHTCALLSGGLVKCWGEGISSIPTTVSGFSAAVQQLAAGAKHTCARLTTGYVQCWGQGVYGQLGTDSVVNSAIPVTVTAVANATAIAASTTSSCAVAGGGLKCWGSIHVQLADSSVVTHTLPAGIMGLTSGVTQVQMGANNYACVTLTSGAVQCFGPNFLGNLAYKSPNPAEWHSVIPVAATNLTSNVVDLKISPAGLFGCAQLNDGSSRCWGDNIHGQLGIGMAESKATPVTVPDLKPAQWTYMLYLVGDNDLSSYLDNIARQLDTLPVNTALNIVVMFDGKRENDSYIWTTRKEGQYRTGLNRWKVDEASSNMGDPATLQRFSEWAHASYPAQHYYLSIADHGRATSGTGWDMQNGKLDADTDKLTPAELRSALHNATYGGAWQLDILHFDSCLMGLLEMAYEVKAYAHYMIASENLTAAFYPYDRYARLVPNEPLVITPPDLAIGIANAYFNYDYLHINDQPRTIAVYDLSQIGPVMNAVNALAIELKSKAPAQIRELRRLVQKFDASPEGTPPHVSYYTITEADEYLDLRDLAYKMQGLSTGAAQSLIDLLDKDRANGFIIFNDKKSGVDRLVSGQHWALSNAHGVAIYFPLGAGGYDYASYVNDQLFTFTADSQWDDFLQIYATGVMTVPYVPPGVPPVLKPTQPITTHCPGAGLCLYGAVFTNTLPVTGAVVTLRHPTGVAITTTAFITENEAFPIFRFPLAADQLQPGELVTLHAAYGGANITTTVQVAPYNREQRVDLVFTTTLTTPHQATTPQVTVVTAAAWTAGIVNGNEITFKAAAVTSDNSPIIRYRWDSDLNQAFGSSASFTLPANRLRAGTHHITVTATNSAGVDAKKPFTFTFTVARTHALFLPLVRR